MYGGKNSADWNLNKYCQKRHLEATCSYIWSRKTQSLNKISKHALKCRVSLQPLTHYWPGGQVRGGDIITASEKRGQAVSNFAEWENISSDASRGGVARLPVHAQVVQLSRLLDSHARKCLRFVKSSISRIPQTLPPVVGFLKRLSRQIRCSNSNSRPFSSIIYVSSRIFPPASSWTPNKGYLRLQAQHVIHQDYLCQVTYRSGF